MNLRLLFLSALITAQGLANEAGRPDTFVHLFEWKWTDIGRECKEFLGPNGYAAVQISPPNEHIVMKNFPWYQRYQPVSYKLQSQGGSEAEFIAMIKDCKSAGVEIYVDAVINHMTATSEASPVLSGSAGSRYGHYNYPGLYAPDDFHDCGRGEGNEIRNYHDRFEVQNCELGNLADLKTEKQLVQETLSSYLQRLIDLGVAGFRIDAAKHIPTLDLKNIFSKVEGKFYVYQEVIGSDSEPIQAREYLSTGAVSEFRYVYQVGSFFQDGKISWFNNNTPLGESWGYLPGEKSVVFIDNHDSQRSEGTLSHKSKTKYQLANVFMLAWPYGHPQVMSSFLFSDPRQGPPSVQEGVTHSIYGPTGRGCLPEDYDRYTRTGWVCEHRWRAISSMVKFRKVTAGAPVTNWWSNNGNQIAFGRGEKGFVVINNEDVLLRQELKTSLPPGRYCDVISGTIRNACQGEVITVDARGKFTAELLPGKALALHVQARPARKKIRN
ncbi:MAG TPA: alpha-amylase family protein [Bacteriovoracaceae bacterium]|nr:alpha-amylase family protein [Bacteriovoracaceae bacterium]